ncbi:MAG: DUF1573 domain-containing protein [Acidobacteriota bacterium]
MLHRTSHRLFRCAALAVAALALPAIAAAQPKAAADTLIHDFGLMPRGDVSAHTFILRNEGNQDLVISQVRASCACTVVDHPQVIAPGESGEVKVDLDTMQLLGPSTKRVSLFTNDPENPRVDMTIKVDARPYVDVLPGYFRYIVVQGFAEEGAIEQTVWASSPKEFSIVNVESPVDFIDVEWREAEAAERRPEHDGPQWIVKATLRPDAPVGPLTGFINIYTDHAKQKKASIPLSGFVRPVFAVTPSSADFGDLALEEPREAALDLRSFATEDIEIVGIENSVPGIETTWEAQTEGRRFWIRFTVPTDLPKGPFEGTVTVRTNSERVPTVEIPISGNVQ